MVRKCHYCGKVVGILDSFQIYNEDKGKYVRFCKDCYDKIPKKELIRKTTDSYNKEKSKIKPISEKQLLEEMLEVNKKQLENINLIKNIILFFFILFLLGLFFYILGF